MIGDLFQLPPVVTPEDSRDLTRRYKTPHFFGAPVFKQLRPELIELTRIFRQKRPCFYPGAQPDSHS